MRWRELKSKVDEILIYLRDNTNASSRTDIIRYVSAFTYYSRNFTAAEWTVLEPLRDEIYANVVLTDEQKKELINWGNLVRRYIKDKYLAWEKENVIKPWVQSELTTIFQTLNSNRDVPLEDFANLVTEIAEEYNG